MIKTTIYLGHIMKQNQIKNWGLVTGFGSFIGVDYNPTEKLIHYLSKHFSSTYVDIDAIILDVSFERSVQKLARHLQSKPISPLFLLHFGVSRSPYLRIEKQAVNEKNASIPDIDGVHCDGVTIDSKYALTKSLSSSIQTDKLMQHLQKIGFPTKVSNDAGRYVCNSTYYHSLQWTQSQHASTTTSSIFIHVPPNSCIFFEDNRQFIWTSKVLCEAGKEILEWMIEEHVNRTINS